MPCHRHPSSKSFHFALCVALSIVAVPALAQTQEKVIPDTETAPSTPSALVPDQELRVDTDVAKPGAAPGRSVKPAVGITPGAVPFQAGSFLVYPEIDVARVYDDNIYSTKNGKLSDHSWVYSPAIWVQSNWAKHALNFHAGADTTRYESYDTEDTDDYRVSGEGRYDFSADTNAYGGVHYSQEHEDRESPSAQNGLTPTEYTQRRYYAGIFHQFDQISVRIAGTAQLLDYDDVKFVTGGGAVLNINNDDRDRWQYTGGVRVGYEVSPQLQPYVQVAFDNRRYKDAVDDLLYKRNSSGQRYLAGLRVNLPRTLKLDVFAGHMKQDFSDSRLKDVSSPVAGAALQWSAGSQTTVSAYLDRTVEETTVLSVPAPGIVQVASSFKNTYGSAGVEHRFTDQFSARLNASLSQVAYEGVNRDDDYYGANLGFLYRAHKNFYLDVNFAARKLDSSIPTEDFSKRIISVRLGIPFSN